MKLRRIGHQRVDHGLRTGDCFNAAHASRDGTFVNDAGDADVAGARNMRAAAKFAAEAGDVHYPNLVAVLFAEQGHGARF